MADGRNKSAEVVSGLVRSVLAPNPSPFTFTGTRTFIVGEGDVAVIDPGPNLPEHVDRLTDVLAGERVSAILITHNHRDHSPAARALAERAGAPILGCAPLALDDRGPRADDAFDLDYHPDHVLEDGERVSGDGWTLQAVATPGHTSNHLSFALVEEQALFSGDHVMGWSTTVVAPPDGDMAAYMSSLERLLERDDSIYYPAHGPAIERPRAHVRALIGHRRMRERQILSHLESGEGGVAQMVRAMYANIDPALHGAAGRSVLAHLIDLEQRGLARREGEAWSRAA